MGYQYNGFDLNSQGDSQPWATGKELTLFEDILDKVGLKSTGKCLIASKNLSDIGSVATARTNLGIERHKLIPLDGTPDPALFAANDGTIAIKNDSPKVWPSSWATLEIGRNAITSVDGTGNWELYANSYVDSASTTRRYGNGKATLFHSVAGGFAFDYAESDDADTTIAWKNYAIFSSDFVSFGASSEDRDFVVSTLGKTFSLNLLGSNGNLGIDITTPLEKLSVNGNIETLDGHGLISDKLSARDADGLLLVNASDVGVFIKSDGLVAIGHTSPLAKLHVVGTGLLTRNTETPGSTQSRMQIYVDATSQIFAYGDNRSLNIGSIASEGQIGVDAFTVTMSLSVDNDVGIGTALPAGRLHLKDDAAFHFNLQTSNAGNNRTRMVFTDEGDVVLASLGVDLSADNDQFLEFHCGSGLIPQMKIDTNGYVSTGSRLGVGREPANHILELATSTAIFSISDVTLSGNDMPDAYDAVLEVYADSQLYQIPMLEVA